MKLCAFDKQAAKVTMPIVTPRQGYQGSYSQKTPGGVFSGCQTEPARTLTVPLRNVRVGRPGRTSAFVPVSLGGTMPRT